jgi:iron complex outermembrane receptor protein
MRTAALAASLLLALLPRESAAARPADSNEFLDMDLAQLMNINVITQEDIRRSGVTTVPEALAMAPGLQVARVSASTWSVASRGFSGFTSVMSG